MVSESPGSVSELRSGKPGRYPKPPSVTSRLTILCKLKHLVPLGRPPVSLGFPLRLILSQTELRPRECFGRWTVRPTAKDACLTQSIRNVEARFQRRVPHGTVGDVVSPGAASAPRRSRCSLTFHSVFVWDSKRAGYRKHSF